MRRRFPPLPARVNRSTGATRVSRGRMIAGAFGLRKDPFRITPDPQFFFAGAQMRSALEELASALLGRRGLVLVLGDSGTGKTTLLRKMEADLEAAGSIAIIITQ